MRELSWYQLVLGYIIRRVDSDAVIKVMWMNVDGKNLPLVRPK